MTDHTSISPDSSALILRELKIPGRTGPLPSGEWGINIAAALDNFPRQGLQCHAGPWGDMSVGDLLFIYVGDGNKVQQETVDLTEKDKELTMFIPAARIADGFHEVSYSVTRLGGNTTPSEVMKVFVKLTRPGGHDDNDEPGHSKLIMTIPKEILDSGIHKDNVDAGVPITIVPYPNCAVGDVCRVSWGGKFVSSEPLTQDQVDGKVSIVVKINKDIIVAAGDSDASGLEVAFEVYDVVDNRSEDWSAGQRVKVGVKTTLLSAPIVKEAQNNILDIDKLGDEDASAQVVASDDNYQLGDIIVLRVRGESLAGVPVELEIPGEPLDNLPSVPELKVPNAVLRQLAKTQVVFSYRLKKADGSADLDSKGQFVRVDGEVQRLKAPVALDAQQGAINPELASTRIEIPFDESYEAGQALKLFWLGTRPDFSTYLPDLGLRPISDGDIKAGESLFITVAGEHLREIKGGTLELYYQLLIDDTALAKLNRFNAIHAQRESEHLAPLNVGEPRLELPEPEVAGVVDGALPADTPGTTLTVVYLNTVKGDKVTCEWVGSKTGKDTDSIELNSFTAGKRLPFNIKAELIKGNEGGTVSASYFIDRAAGGTSHANALKFSVGEALGLTFTNAPYTIAPGGQLKNIELLLCTGSNSPIAGGTLGLTLPAGFTYADGGSGKREFITDDVGRVSVNGVKGALVSGSYSLTAASSTQTATANVTVRELGPVDTIPVGDRPVGIALSKDGTRAYVSNAGSRTVSVIDTATYRVFKNISVGITASGIAISPDDTRVYVCNQGSHTVSVIDTATNRVLADIPSERSPTSVAVSPDGTRAYLSCYGGVVSVIDTATNHVLTNIPFQGTLEGVAVSPDGTSVYVCQNESRMVGVIDTATDHVRSNIPVVGSPNDITISPDGTRAYVSDNSATVTVIDTATDRVLTSILVGGGFLQGIAVSPDGTRAYVAVDTNFVVAVIDTAENRVLTRIPVERTPRGVKVSPDGNRAYVCNIFSHTVSVIDAATQ